MKKMSNEVKPGTKFCLVLAGNFREWQRFAADLQNKEKEEQNAAWAKGWKFIYVDRPEQMMGLYADDFMTIGTFFKREDAGALYDFAKTRLMRFPNPPHLKAL